MEVRVDIEGKVEVLDLTRLYLLSELYPGVKVIASHPETKKLCKAVVMEVTESSVIIKDLARVIAPYRWRISKGSLHERVYKINK